jgi:hypothetical protein
MKCVIVFAVFQLYVQFSSQLLVNLNVFIAEVLKAK